MASRKLWLLALLPLAAVLAHRRMGHERIHRFGESMHTSSMPDPGLYDAVVGRVMQPFYSSVARQMAFASPSSTALEVGSGPGRLAVAMGVVSPHVRVTALDIDPEMVAIGNRKAAEAGVSDRVSFEVGDVGAMPFGDGQFDLVVSTFSMHHWEDAGRGVAEIQRVLKPGGMGCIYDFSGSIQHAFQEGAALAGSPELLESGRIEPVLEVGPIRLIQRFRWIR